VIISVKLLYCHNNIWNKIQMILSNLIHHCHIKYIYRIHLYSDQPVIPLIICPDFKKIKYERAMQNFFSIPEFENLSIIWENIFCVLTPWYTYKSKRTYQVPLKIFFFLKYYFNSQWVYHTETEKIVDLYSSAPFFL